MHYTPGLNTFIARHPSVGVTKQQSSTSDTIPSPSGPKLKKCCDTDTANSCSKNCKWSLANSGPCTSLQTQC